MRCGGSLRRRSRSGIRAVGIAAILSALTLSACTSGGSTAGGGRPTAPHGYGSSAPGLATPSTPPPAAPAVITTSAVASKKIDPTTPVVVSISHGTLTAVTMTNPAGKEVTGTLAADGSSWHDTEDLGYGKAYTIKAVGTNADGTSTTKHEVLTTVTPHNQVAVSMDRTGDYPLDAGTTYGVALVPEMYFDQELSAAGKKAAQRAVTVPTSPHVDGAWAWQDDSRMLWRPKNYWPAGTRVMISAKIYGVHFGGGLYGQADESSSFSIGRKQLTVADDNAPQVDKVRVYNAAGAVLRTMDTSMGQHTGVTVNGNYINFYTLNGTYTVLEKDNPAIMSSASYGLPVKDGGYAPFPVPYSTKISVDGIYLHEYNSTIYQQEHGIDASEGCLNLQTSDAAWFFDHSLIGDPVVVHGATGAPEITVAQGGAWSVPWKTWLTGNLGNN